MRKRWDAPDRRAAILPFTLVMLSAFALCALVALGISARGTRRAPSAEPVAQTPSSGDFASDAAAIAPAATVASVAPVAPVVLAAAPAEPLAATTAASPQETPAAAPVAPGARLIAGTLGRGETLSTALDDHDVPARIVDQIASEMRGYFDFRRSHAGDGYQLVLDDSGEIESFRYRVTKLIYYELSRSDDGFAVERVETKLTPRQTMVAGVVKSSLYGAITELGAGPQLANDFADVFAYDVDFSRMVRPGDEFRILYERLYRTLDDGTEVYEKPGRILAARYMGQNGEHTAVYFESEKGQGGYYRPDGSAVARQFLMAPLRYSRISSSYSNARRHPILKITRPHHGIDYAAPQGTPVYAVASGEVVYKSRAGGYGNLVKIKHSNGYTTFYAHLSRFATGLRNGQHVGQKQVIGYVGSTGLATGPHVCFRVRNDKSGQFVNPLRIASPAGPPLPQELMDPFRSYRDSLLAALDSGTLVAADEAL